MAIDPSRITIAPFLQRWAPDTGTLTVHLMVIPSGDPFQPLTTGLAVPPGPAFVNCALSVRASLSASVHALPMRSAIDSTADFALPAPADRAAHFTRLKTQFKITRPDAVPTRKSGNTVRKYLPPSYRQAFGFVAPRTGLATVDDAYHCALHCPPNTPPSAGPKPKDDVGWGEALGFVTRQPELARQMGVLYTLDIAVPGSVFAHGGWMFFDLSPASDYAAAASSAGFVRSYATRVPELTGLARPVFTPVLFPVSIDPADASTRGNFDQIFAEAIQYDDGFAKIVHATQDQEIDPSAEGAPLGGVPREQGIAIGWDDEAVVEAINRQIGLLLDGSTPVEAPMGVAGYRVDARLQGDAGWNSLCAAHASGLVYGAPISDFDGELRVEVHPSRLEGALWLPAWFTNWSGPSLVVRTLTQKKLAGIPAAGPSQYTPVGPAIDLRYGSNYELRVRMVDTTGGGPTAASDRDAPTATVAFRRYVKPHAVAVIADGALAWRVARPMLGYPEAVLAGAANAEARLLAIHDANDAAHSSVPVEIADPDVPNIEIRVLVRAPAFDPTGGSTGWKLLYVTTRPYPSDESAQLSLVVSPIDAARLADLDISGQTGAEGSVTGALPIPTARDVRLEISALGRNDLTYFGADDARRGPIAVVETHAQAFAEPDLLAPLPPSDSVRSVFLRPDPAGGAASSAALAVQNDGAAVLAARFAAAVGLVESDGTILGQEGVRTVFAATAGLSHVRAPDGTGIALTARAELANQWVSAIRFRVARDWTWKGFGQTARLTRRIRLLPAGTAAPTGVTDPKKVAELQVTHAVNLQACRGTVDRDFTDLVFLDAFTPPLASTGFPHELAVEWTLSWTLETGEEIHRTLSNDLPVTDAPRQLPEVVSAGYALSPYASDDAYTHSTQRTRMLWLEFAAPPADPRDRYFVRFLAHSPDPMLLPQTQPVPDPTAYAQWVIDPEAVRIITPGQADDFAGLGSMAPLIPAVGSDRHFLVPLPANTHPESPELFGFYVIELRVGHAAGAPGDPFWSTAQGRFGPPQQLEGVQFPAPGLALFVTRTSDAIEATAPFASPWYEGRRLLPRRPNTELWFVLYAQVWQADRQARRNVQLAMRRGSRIRDPKPGQGVRAAQPREVSAHAVWNLAETEALLAEVGLPPTSPLSVLAIELLPEPNGAFADPLGGDLGEVRVLRSSPLAAVVASDC
jgi:hypothetical protein